MSVLKYERTKFLTGQFFNLSNLVGSNILMFESKGMVNQAFKNSFLFLET